MDAPAALAHVGGDRILLLELTGLALLELQAQAAALCALAAEVRAEPEPASRAGLAAAVRRVKALRRIGHAVKGCAASMMLTSIVATDEALLIAVRPLDDDAAAPVPPAARREALRRLLVEAPEQARALLGAIRDFAVLVQQRPPALFAAVSPQQLASLPDGARLALQSDDVRLALDALFAGHPWLAPVPEQAGSSSSSSSGGGGSRGSGVGGGELQRLQPPPPAGPAHLLPARLPVAPVASSAVGTGSCPCLCTLS